MREESKFDIISAEELGTRYDQASKIIWRNREILAPLLKYSVRELADESVESIMKLIDANSIIEDTSVSDLPAVITKLGTEQTSTTEKIVTFDYRFNVKNPKLSDENILVVLHEIDKYTPASRNEELKKEVETMPGMGQVIYNRGITQGIEQGQNLIVTTVQRLRGGETREDIIASGVDEHTVDLAISINTAPSTH